MTTLIIDTDTLLGWIPTDTTRNTFPAAVTAHQRVDIRMRDGSEFYGTAAYTWAWGEARDTTITHWRYAQ